MMTEEERITKAVREAAKEAVHDTLMALGIDIDDGREMNADMLWLRRHRQGSEEMGKNIRRGSVALAVSGVAYALWEGFKAALRQDGGP